MSEMYVLMEAGWDYNDEFFYRSEGSGGHPHKVYASKEAAQTECASRNVARLKELFNSGEISEYYEGFHDLLPYNKTHDAEFYSRLDGACNKIFGVDFEQLGDIERRHEYKRSQNPSPQSLIKDSATDANWLELFNCTKLEFWEVVNVEKED